MKTSIPAGRAARLGPYRVPVRRLAPFLAVGVFAAFAATAFGGSSVYTSSIGAADPVVTNPPTGTSPSACGSATPSPSARSGTFHYEVYSFRNISQAVQCVNVSVATVSGWTTASAYLTSFNPASPSTNFIGGFGLPGYIDSAGAADGFSFNVSCFFCMPDSPEVFQVVVSEGFANQGANYTLLVEGTGIIPTGGGATSATGLRSFRATSAARSVVVRWRTRSEQNLLGFNVYRGDRRKVRLTHSVVRAAGDLRGHTYTFTDRTPQRGKAAPYYLELVQPGGSRLMFGPALSTAR
jgi:hypothetical protein